MMGSMSNPVAFKEASMSTPRISLEDVEGAFAIWRDESDLPASTYRSRMNAYGAAVELLDAYKAQAAQDRIDAELAR